jgi:hypothetical protein
MSFVTIEDFTLRYENTVPDMDVGRVEALIADACALAESIAGTIAEPAPAVIVATVCTAVRRAYENPSGLQGETIGDYSWRTGYTGVSGSANVGVYFTVAEQRTIRRANGQSSVGTIELEGMLPNSVDAGQYLSDGNGGDPILYFAEEDLV